MGLFKMSVGTYPTTSSYIPPKDDKNPNPRVFKITEEFFLKHQGAVAIKVTYPNCINYEGNKVLVYRHRGKLKSHLKLHKHLDPHFMEDSLSPVARFEPTEEGWELAKALVRGLTQG